MSDGAAPSSLEALLQVSGAWLDHETPRKLAVAVSGGGDSMALLSLMVAHGRARCFPVVAVTLDHGLRPEAADEIALVARYCASHQIEHHVLNWSWDREGNLQARAREARYSLISDLAQRLGADVVALGHTQNDVAETFLMRLGRQAGLAGLSHMRSRFQRHGVGWVRPLLAVSRSDLRAYLRAQGIAWAEDPSNEDPKFDRVNARAALRALEPLGFGAGALAAVARNLAMANDALEQITVSAARDCVEAQQGDLLLPAPGQSKGLGSAENDLPPDVQRRLQSAAFRYVGGGSYPPRAAALEDLVHAMQGAKGYTLQGCLVTPVAGLDGAGQRWRITREYNAIKDLACPVADVWDGRWSLAGPEESDLEIAALGDGIAQCPDWRTCGMPRASLMASPAVWRGAELVAAPLAGVANGWSATLVPPRDDFAAFLLAR